MAWHSLPHIYFHQHGLISMVDLFYNSFYHHLFCCSVSLISNPTKLAPIYILSKCSHCTWAIIYFMAQQYPWDYFLMSSWIESQNVVQKKQFCKEPKYCDSKMLLMVLFDSRKKFKETIGMGTLPPIFCKYHFFPKQVFDKIWASNNSRFCSWQRSAVLFHRTFCDDGNVPYLHFPVR